MTNHIISPPSSMNGINYGGGTRNTAKAQASDLLVRKRENEINVVEGKEQQK